jgi:hypothetical protein
VLFRSTDRIVDSITVGPSEIPLGWRVMPEVITLPAIPPSCTVHAQFSVCRLHAEIETAGAMIRFAVHRPGIRWAAIVGVGSDRPELSDDLRCSPNPSNASVTFEYHVDIRSYIQIEIFNTIGQKIITLENDWEDGGTHSVCWNARDMSSGVYFSRLSMKVAGANPSLTVVRKVVLVR